MHHDFDSVDCQNCSSDNSRLIFESCSKKVSLCSFANFVRYFLSKIYDFHSYHFLAILCLMLYSATHFEPDPVCLIRSIRFSLKYVLIRERRICFFFSNLILLHSKHFRFFSFFHISNQFSPRQFSLIREEGFIPIIILIQAHVSL